MLPFLIIGGSVKLKNDFDYSLIDQNKITKQDLPLFCVVSHNFMMFHYPIAHKHAHQVLPSVAQTGEIQRGIKLCFMERALEFTSILGLVYLHLVNVQQYCETFMAIFVLAIFDKFSLAVM